MAQRIFTFHSPTDMGETIEMIVKSVTALKGKAKVRDNLVIARWRSKRSRTIFRHKFKFYVGKDMVRVVTGDDSRACRRIKWELKCRSMIHLWDDFVISLSNMFPDLNFELESGRFHIVSAKIMSDGIEQVFSSTSVSTPSIGGALIGGALFGGVGAIVGGSGGRTRTSGTTRSAFSDKVLVAVRYSNGMNLEGEVSKRSAVYNKIIVSLSELTND